MDKQAVIRRVERIINEHKAKLSSLIDDEQDDVIPHVNRLFDQAREEVRHYLRRELPEG